MSDAAISALVSAVITIVPMIIGFLTLWVKLKYGAEQAEKAAVKAQVVEDKLDSATTKIDTNTIITKAGAAAASNNAREAAKSAADAKAATGELAKKLNGGLDHTLQTVIAPIRDALEEHMKKDAEDLEEIKAKVEDHKAKFDEHVAYVHQRHHDILDAVGVLSNKLTALIMKSEK